MKAEGGAACGMRLAVFGVRRAEKIWRRAERGERSVKSGVRLEA